METLLILKIEIYRIEVERYVLLFNLHQHLLPRSQKSSNRYRARCYLVLQNSKEKGTSEIASQAFQSDFNMETFLDNSECSFVWLSCIC